MVRAPDRPRVILSTVALAVAVGTLAGCAEITAPKLMLTGSGADSAFGVSDARLHAFASYSEPARLLAYATIQAAYESLWDGYTGASPVAEGPTPRGYLQLEDRDGDGGVDFYAYLPEPGIDETQDFGAIFDLDRDGRPDWIVFYGGVFPAADQTVLWWSHHAIDRNRDGRADVYVTDLVDHDGDGLMDLGRTAWIYDDDFDGRIDRAEHLTADGAVALKVENGAYASGHILWPLVDQSPRPGGEMPTALLDTIGNDAMDLLYGLLADVR